MRKKGYVKRKNFTRGEAARKEVVRCYECNKPGHMKMDCPLLQQKVQEKKPAKRSLIAEAWQNLESILDDDSDQEDGTATIAVMDQENVAFMALEDEEVSDDEPPSYDELHESFLEVFDKYRKIAKEKVALKAELDVCNKEKDALKEENIKLKNEVKKLSKMPNVEGLEKERDDLKKKVSEYEALCQNLTKGKENLDKLLGQQNCSQSKHGLGFNGDKHVMHKQTHFVRASSSYRNAYKDRKSVV